MSTTQPEVATIWQALSAIPDPEFGINIVDLGFIYEVGFRDGHVNVVMTLTTPTCPSGGWICDGVAAAVRALEGVTSVQVDLVFEPAWHSGLLSAEARRQLGCLEEPVQ
jgi:metal-sulfur cluster biosynthetic enzyme